MNLSPKHLTFDAMYSAYTAVLHSQPGKALRLPDGGAIFLEDGEVYAVTLNEAGEVEMVGIPKRRTAQWSVWREIAQAKCHQTEEKQRHQQ